MAIESVDRHVERKVKPFERDVRQTRREFFQQPPKSLVASDLIRVELDETAVHAHPVTRLHEADAQTEKGSLDRLPFSVWA